jgi:hypothetical protein
MTAPKRYVTANALRTALEARLYDRARRDGVDLQRLRRQVAFDRLLARMFDPSHSIGDDWVLKGGYALELRFSEARSTKDLDLTARRRTTSLDPFTSFPASLRERLQIAAATPLSDFFTFVVGEMMAELTNCLEGGARFPVDARLDGRTFVAFHVDLGVGDDVIEPLDRIRGEDWLGFAGIPAVIIPALSSEQHWAEKLHAYTRPRKGTNTRVRDLVDLVMILERTALSPERLREAVDVTFGRRHAHGVPDVVPPPPSAWTKPFAVLAAECGLNHTPATAHRHVTAFWETIRAVETR